MHLNSAPRHIRVFLTRLVVYVHAWCDMYMSANVQLVLYTSQGRFPHSNNLGLRLQVHATLATCSDSCTTHANFLKAKIVSRGDNSLSEIHLYRSN